MQRRCCHPPPPSHFPSLGYVGISVVRHLYKHTTAPSHGKTKKPSSPFPIAKNKKKRTKERRGEKTPIHLDPSVFLFTFVKQSQKRMGAKRGGGEIEREMKGRIGLLYKQVDGITDDENGPRIINQNSLK